MDSYEKKCTGQGKQENLDQEIVNDFYNEDFASGDHNNSSKCFRKK